MGDTLATERARRAAGRTALEDFVPLVPAVEGPAECRGPTRIEGRDGMGYRIVFETTPPRWIGIWVDDEDRVESFTDARGPDPEGPGEPPPGDVTRIFLGRSDSLALAENIPAGGEPTTFRFPFPGAADAPELGTPSQGIQRILATCVTGGSPGGRARTR